MSDLVRVLESPRPAWEIRYRKLLATRPVTLNFPGTPIAEVIEFLRDITGLNLTLAPGLKPDLSPKVHVRLRNTTLLRALDLICEEANFRWSLTHGTVYLQPLEAGERLLEPVTWPFDAAEQPAQGVALIAALRSETQSSWTPGTEVRCEKGELRVLQTPTGHKRVAAFLVRRRPPPPPAVLADAWFAPAPLSGASPAQARTRLYAMGLLEEGSLTVDGSVKTALESLRRSCPTPIRVDPSAEAIVANTSVSLVLTAVTFRDALGLVCASEARLVWEVDRRGVLVRSAHAPPLTLRLRRAAQRALSRTDERDLRLRLQSHPLTLNFDQTPLSQILDFLRGVTGIDYFVTRAARPALTEEITLRSKGAPLIDVLERILAPLRLGIDLHQGFVRIVPAVQATEGRQFEARRDAFRSRPLGSKALVGVDVYAFARALEASGPAIVVIDPSLFGSRLRLLIPADCSVGLALQFARLEAGIDWGLAWLQREGCFALVLRRGSRHRIQAGLTRLAEPCPWVEPPAEIARAWEQSQATLRTALTKVSLAREAEDLDALLKALTSATNAAQSRAVCYRTLATPRGRKYLEERANTTRLLVQEIEANHATTRRAALDRRAKHSLERKLEEDLARHHRALVDAPLPPDGDFEALRSEDARRRAVRAELRALQDEIARNSKDHLLRLARLDSTCRQLEDRLERVCLLSGRFAIVGALAERLRRGESLQAVFPKGFRAWLASSRREDVEVYRLGRSHVAAHGAGVTLVGAGLESGDRVLTLEGTPITDWLTLVEAVGRGLLRTEPGATLRLRAEVLRQGVRLEVQLALLRPTRER
ncbi:MAG: hypothetical protein JKY65_19950 [Planctomycetes bacterium]|nr:hypothetical protein [Planctomycetota bacterium]